MRRIRINGIVRDAEALRRALSQPMTASQCDVLKERVAESVRQIQTLLRQHNASPGHLPPQSQRAYAFLEQFDPAHAKIVSQSDSAPRDERYPPGSIRFRGMSAFLDRLLDDIARNVAAETLKPDKTLHVIQQTAQRLEHDLQRDAIEPEHLTKAARQMLGWFRFFSDAETFGRYVEAIKRAGGVFTSLPQQPNWRSPLLIHFRPTRRLFSWRVHCHGTRMVLNVPMITFDRDTFSKLGHRILGDKGDRAAISQAQLSDAYQSVLIEFENAQGVIEHTAGMTHDLAASFDRVNAKYFGGMMVRPKLAWIGKLTGRVFGHYDLVHDRLSISSTLDREDVPAFVLDHVMHHELLHKKHGATWRDGRRHAHTRDFRGDERTFGRFDEADAFLNALACTLVG